MSDTGLKLQLLFLARSYFDTGISMLASNHWDAQYALSLDLWQRYASACFIVGDIKTMKSCLHETLNHAKSFDDSLMARSLAVQLLASSGKFDDAMDNGLMMLQNLGEEFPRGEISLFSIQDMLNTALPTLKNIASNPDLMKNLFPMSNCNKLDAMQVMAILRKVNLRSHSKLIPFLGWRMVSMTLEYGLCDESIIGLVVTGLSLVSILSIMWCVIFYDVKVSPLRYIFVCILQFRFTEHVHLGYRIGKIGEALIEENSMKHLLWSQITLELGTLKMAIEPPQSVISVYPERYNSAMISGDVDSAMGVGVIFCIANFYLGLTDLNTASKHFVSIMKEALKYKKNGRYFQANALLNPCLYLAGASFPGNFDADGIELRCFNDLDCIAQKTNDSQLLFECFIGRITCLFWMAKYKEVADLCKQIQHVQKSLLDVIRFFYEGIASLSLARETSGEESQKSREKGIACVSHMTELEKLSAWNFSHRARLLQAELHFTMGFIALAESTYILAIQTACEHKFKHDASLAHELYGKFCVKNRKLEKGQDHLTLALDGYREWGATRKVNDLQQYINQVQIMVSNEEL